MTTPREKTSLSPHPTPEQIPHRLFPSRCVSVVNMWHYQPRLDRETAISAYLVWSLLVIALGLFGLLAVVVI